MIEILKVTISALTFIVALTVAAYGVYQYHDSNRPDLVVHPVDGLRTNSTGDGKYSESEHAVFFVLTNIGRKPAFDINVRFDPRWDTFHGDRWQGAKYHILMPGENRDIIYQRYDVGPASYDNKDLMELERSFEITYYGKSGLRKKKKPFTTRQVLLADEATSAEENRLYGGGFAANMYE